MPWLEELLDRLCGTLPCGYHADGPASSEPTALAALALTAHKRSAAAGVAIDWLSGRQSADGSVGPTATQATPGWPTALAVLAANCFAKTAPPATVGLSRQFDASKAVAWILQTKGEALPRNDATGHDTTLIGWPWVEETHSWVEPTAMQVLALKATGFHDHPRTREAVRLLIDRLLPGGGCNYGNTVVMGQELRPHLQPTGLAMMALAGETDRDGRIVKSLDFFARELSPRTAAASLAYGLLGMAAHGRLPRDSQSWLEIAYRRTVAREAAPYRLALLALAALGEESPLIVKQSTADHADGRG
jgi:hypothetical protein